MNEQDVAKVYETLLCTPGMNETVKLDHKISRKTILLLSQIVSHGMAGKNDDAKGMPGIADKESIAELTELITSSLDKAGLTALNAKLQEL